MIRARKKVKVSAPALADVARIAGVGSGTVSRVINGGKNVSPKTLAKVRAVMQELGYEPSFAARALKGAPSNTIGLIVPTVADPFFSSSAAAIQEVAGLHGTLVLLAASENDPRKEEQEVSALIRRRVDGMILAPSPGSSRTLLQHAAFPVVCFDRPMADASLTTVLADNYGGARVAVEHLVDRGYKRILCVGGYGGLLTSQKRFQAHKDVVREAGLPYLAELGAEDFVSTQSALLRHIRGADRVDAIFSTKNTTTVCIYKVLKELGVRIPGQIGLIGFDDFDLADVLDPPISVVRQPITRIATRAAELLFDEMDHRKPASAITTLDVELVLRGSC
ncbi:LacI family DNA-binding transcriptional regulator [Occallatibacter riparius]|uniref:LacI family transcriptional regulator n=1 Tax=Occallatibacter riparius TaxID=1002689 RepID=A0A9J7BWD4_9BACT|nr:LacI family DNA-binding transcriptional regulator [Occallatibacter riparius]UWZ86817.1 LacI family transcriptional regulator [Occallatibacter riparius]